MSLLAKIKAHWTQDQLMQKVIRNSGYLFSSNSISAGLSSIQGILAAILLRPSGYGTLGIIIGIVTNVNRLLSFRMTEVVIKYAGHYLANDEKEKAGAVVKIAAITESITSLTAYILLYLAAPFAAGYFIKDTGAFNWAASVPLIRYYGLIILFNIVTETSTAVLNIGGYFRVQAGINLVQSVFVMALITGAYVFKAGIFVVITAYLIGKLFIGVSTFFSAISKMPDLFGKLWWKAPVASLGNIKEMGHFAISSNLSGTLNLVVRDSEVLWVGLFLSTEAAGYYKFALAVMNVILMPITPFISTTYPEMNRSISLKNWNSLRHLIKRTTVISGVWTSACGVGMLLLGPWLLGLLKDGVYLPSFPLILVLFIGYGTANLLFWNRNLLLAFDLPNYPLKVTIIIGAIKTVLMFFLVKPFGAMMQGALLSGYLMLSIVIMSVRGYKELQHRDAMYKAGESGW